jgi:hypothetical protein
MTHIRVYEKYQYAVYHPLVLALNPVYTRTIKSKSKSKSKSKRKK